MLTAEVNLMYILTFFITIILLFIVIQNYYSNRYINCDD